MRPKSSTPQMIANDCAQCGQTYYRRWPSLVGKFCSIPCANLAKIQPPEERFWSKVTKTAGCWLFDKPGTDGYGKFWVNGRSVHAHRFAWELVNGPMPPEMVARHTCDNPLCVRPDHVVPGSNLDNTQDMIERGRKPIGEQSSNAKLTAVEVIEIRARRTKGEKLAVLAAAYGMSHAQISAISRRKSWKHVA